MKTWLEIPWWNAPGRYGFSRGMDVMCTRLTGYFLTASVFIVVEACRGLQTALANAPTTFVTRKRAGVTGRDETRRGDERRAPHRRVCRASFSNFRTPFTSVFQALLGYWSKFRGRHVLTRNSVRHLRVKFLPTAKTSLTPSPPPRRSAPWKNHSLRVSQDPDLERGGGRGMKKSSTACQIFYPPGALGLFFSPPSLLDSDTSGLPWNWTSIFPKSDWRVSLYVLAEISGAFSSNPRSLTRSVSSPLKHSSVPAIWTLSGDLPLPAPPTFPGDARHRRERSRFLDFLSVSPRKPVCGKLKGAATSSPGPLSIPSRPHVERYRLTSSGIRTFRTHVWAGRTRAWTAISRRRGRGSVRLLVFFPLPFPTCPPCPFL